MTILKTSPKQFMFLRMKLVGKKWLKI